MLPSKFKKFLEEVEKDYMDQIEELNGMIDIVGDEWQWHQEEYHGGWSHDPLEKENKELIDENNRLSRLVKNLNKQLEDLTIQVKALKEDLTIEKNNKMRGESVEESRFKLIETD